MPPPEQKAHSEMVELPMKLDADQARDVQHLMQELGSPNMGTALYNAVLLLNDLYAFKKQGYQIRLVKNGETRRFDLP